MEGAGGLEAFPREGPRAVYTFPAGDTSTRRDPQMLPVCVQTVFVTDLDEAVRFYTEALGYEVKRTYGSCIVQLKTGSTTLILEQIQPGSGPTSPATVLSFQTEDIRASMRKIVEAGGELVHAEPRRCPVGLVEMFKDKAGVLHDLLQFDPA
jgi:predicted enzyme related to lactoylglutathione lyase